MAETAYQDPFPTMHDETPYRLVSADGVTVERFGQDEVLRVAPEVLHTLAREAMRDVERIRRSGPDAA